VQDWQEFCLFRVVPQTLLLITAAAACFMAGLIWLVQLVHYPLFANVGPEHWPTYHAKHTFWITPIVAPVMLAELATAAALLWWRPAGVPGWALWLGLALAGLMWLSTAALQVPAHNKLGAAWDAATHQLLVQTNWLRTIGWTARAVLMLWVCRLMMK
jgi:hypothetical protein